MANANYIRYGLFTTIVKIWRLWSIRSEASKCVMIAYEERSTTI